MLLFKISLMLSGASTELERGQSACIEQGDCKPWFVRCKNMPNCTCGNSLSGVLSCSENPPNVFLKPCYCMTVDLTSNDTMVGACPYTCVFPRNWNSNITWLNYHMCSETWKRTGWLCSQCMDNHGPPVYSYTKQCIPCSTNVVRLSMAFLLLSFLPLTLFCLIIITLRIGGARPPMSTFILVSQVMSAPQYISLVFRPTTQKPSPYIKTGIHNMVWKLFATFFGIWNLDIGRAFYPPICLSPNMSTLQAHFLEYTIALFPLATLFVVAITVKLYNRGNRIIFLVCRPIHSCLAHLRRAINVRNSIIDAFVTFIILSQNKIGYTSFRILQPINVFFPNGKYNVSTYLDPTYKYFGLDHLPYALFALIFSVVFIVIPVLLLFLYPCTKIISGFSE